MKLEFSSRQQFLITQAITGLAMLTLVALVVATFRGLLHFLVAFSGVFLPLASAGVLSLLLRPVYQFLHQRWKLPSAAAVTVLFLLMLVPLFMVIRIFGGLALTQINQLIQSAPAAMESLRGYLATHAPVLRELLDKVGGEEAVRDWLGRNSGALYALAAGSAQGFFSALGAAGALLQWAVLPVYLIFFLIAPPFRIDQLGQFLPYVQEETRKDILFLVRQFVDIVVVFFRGQLSIALAQGILMAVGFSLCGLSYGFVLGLLFGLLNLVPYLGNLIALSIVLPLAFLQQGGGWGLVTAVLVVLAVTQAVESYILTPRILGDKTGLHPMAVVFAMFFWGKAIGGIFGLILAIPLTAFLVVFWRLAREKYLPKTADSSKSPKGPPRKKS